LRQLKHLGPVRGLSFDGDVARLGQEMPQALSDDGVIVGYECSNHGTSSSRRGRSEKLEGTTSRLLQPAFAALRNRRPLPSLRLGPPPPTLVEVG
jgi:hypothetical protein